MREPAKVSISPKATSTLLSITPAGGIHIPAVSNAHPKVHSATARSNCPLGGIDEAEHVAIQRFVFALFAERRQVLCLLACVRHTYACGFHGGGETLLYLGLRLGRKRVGAVKGLGELATRVFAQRKAHGVRFLYFPVQCLNGIGVIYFCHSCKTPSVSPFKGGGAENGR